MVRSMVRNRQRPLAPGRLTHLTGYEYIRGTIEKCQMNRVPISANENAAEDIPLHPGDQYPSPIPSLPIWIAVSLTSARPSLTPPDGRTGVGSSRTTEAGDADDPGPGRLGVDERTCCVYSSPRSSGISAGASVAASTPVRVRVHRSLRDAGWRERADRLRDMKL